MPPKQSSLQIIILYTYYLLGCLLLPLYLIILAYRVVRNKEDIKRIAERFGIASQARDSNKYLIWLHAASVGESLVAVTLINALNSINFHKFNLCFLVTTATKSSCEILKQKLPSNAVHQFLPIDNVVFVKKFLKYWQPKLGIFIDSELWPVITTEGAKICRLLLFNARLSDKSFDIWKKFSFFFRIIAANFTSILLQSENDLKKFRTLGVKTAINLGNIKFSNKKLKINEMQSIIFANLLKDRKVTLFASTHHEDEKVILPIIKSLKIIFPSSYFIIALRHPERAKEIGRECQKYDLSYSLRSAQKTLPNLDNDLYIIDTFDELGLFFNLAHISFIGGSFGRGGHNPLEAAHFHNLILFGPDMSNCRDMANEMIARKAAIQVQNTNELKEQLEYFLEARNDNVAQFYKNNAYRFLVNQQQILDSYIAIVKNLISSKE